jgi:hypothetical protein
VTPVALPEALGAYGPSGSCWAPGDVAATCEFACAASTQEQRRAHPGSIACGSDADAGPRDGGVVDGEGADAAADITWTSLYADFFGAAAPGPACSGDVGKCHGGVSDPGSAASAFICGATKDACYNGLTSKAAGLVDTGNPLGSVLLSVLRHSENGILWGNEPRGPQAYSFSAASMKRIADWIAAGAKNE